MSEEYKVIHQKLEKKLWKQLAKRAIDKGISVNKLVVQVVTEYLSSESTKGKKDSKGLKIQKIKSTKDKEVKKSTFTTKGTKGKRDRKVLKIQKIKSTKDKEVKRSTSTTKPKEH